ncbi:MAG: response regulator, partial [Anaerolineaceae bacterium]|nr:response regulator [Anaerolineaceae bacterium]
QGWQCRPIAAASGAQALERLAEAGERPDLIIADYQLDPGENGVAAAQTICARLGGPIPTLVISAHASTEMTEQVHRAGCQFLAKPLQKGPLRSLLAHLLKDRLAAG